MNKKMLGGIIVLIALVGIAGVFLLIDRSTDTGPKKVYKAPSEEALQKVRGDLAAQKAQNTAKPPPPGETYETGHWDGDHWHRTAPVNTQPSDGEYGVTRQGKRYIKNPAVANFFPASKKKPIGPPLNIDWKSPTKGDLDWTDPRTLESYRNYWGFDPPADGPFFHPVEDNWGYRFRHYRNTAAVTYFNKRQGFRPTVEELKRYKHLQAELELVGTFGNSSETQRIKNEIRELVANAQGELPNFAGSRGRYYGDEQTPEMRRIRQAEADKNVYRRMGIEHLYEFYEVEPYE